MKKVIIVILVIVVAFCYFVTRDDNKQSAPVYNAPAYNGNVNYVPNPVYPDYNSLDNSDTTVVQQPQQQICPVCHGSGACPICHGTGTVSYYGDRTGCSACDDYSGGVESDGSLIGNGRCSTCHGTGLY